jgi:hypothetical protein
MDHWEGWYLGCIDFRLAEVFHLLLSQLGFSGLVSEDDLLNDCSCNSNLLLGISNYEHVLILIILNLWILVVLESTLTSQQKLTLGLIFKELLVTPLWTNQ